MYLSTQSVRPRGAYLMGAPHARPPALRGYRRMRLLRGLGAMTPEEAVESVFPKSAITGKPGFSQADYDNMVQAVKSGNFYQSQGWHGGTMESEYCKGQSPSSVAGSLTKTSTGIAVSLASTIVPMQAIPFIGIGAAVVGLFVSLFTHHSRMVAQEQRLFCATLPAARDTLTAIEQSVSSGKISPQDGITALQQLQQQVTQNLAQMVQMDATHCNAECIWTKQLREIVAYLSSQWQDQIAAAAASPAAGVESTVSSAAASLGIPSWALYAAGALLLWKVL